VLCYSPENKLPAYADSVALAAFTRRTPLLLNAGHAAIN